MKLTLCFLMAMILVTLPVRAHAFLDHADPKVGSAVSVAPHTVKVWFTQEVNPAATRIAVYDASGKEIDLRKSRQDRTDPVLISVDLPDLPKGVYTVAWKATCLHGHHTEGKFTFEIAP